MPRINTKTFILFCFLFLSLPLFAAFQNIGESSREYPLGINFNSTSGWTRLQLEGAEIVEAMPQNNQIEMDWGPDYILIKEPGKFAINAKIRTAQRSIKFIMEKDPLGLASVEINDIGTLDDLNLPMKVPLRIKTNSSFGKITFTGVKILSASTNERHGTATYSIDNNSISLNNPPKSDLDINFAVNLSSQDASMMIVLEKGNDGSLQANLGNFVYYNNQTGNKKLKNLIMTVEMTSNKSQIFFDQGRIVKGEVLQLDERDLEENIIGQDFIYIKYSHGGDQFRRAKYLLDLDLNDNNKLVIYKSNTGFVNVREGSNSYFVTDFGENLPYTKTALELRNVTQKKHEPISIPVAIKTSSDWTDVRFNGLEGIALGIDNVDGDVEVPGIMDGSISLHKKGSADMSIARLNLTLKADDQNNPSITIDKGDIGATEVNVGDRFVVNNSQKIEGDSRNSMTYSVPQLPFAEDLIELNNPVDYVIPIYSLVSDSQMENKKGNEENPTLTISRDDLPGRIITMRDSMAKGVVAYILLSYIILILFWLQELGKEGYFQALWSDKFTGRSAAAFARTKFEDAPISSVIIFEALISLAVTPFMLLISERLANATAILAYLFLVAGVAARFLEMKNILAINKQNELILKIEFVAILMAAGYVGCFEMMNAKLIPALVGIIGITIATAMFVLILFAYLKSLYSTRTGREA
jgi:hypothetical protein